MSRTEHRDRRLAEALAAAHRRWLDEAREFLGPAAARRRADFWSRWGAVRYLDNEFQERYGREAALVRALAPYLAPADAGRLTAYRETLDRVRHALRELGSRRGTARGAAVLARHVLELLQLWCDELEQAAAGVQWEALPDEVRRSIAELGACASAQP